MAGVVVVGGLAACGGDDASSTTTEASSTPPSTEASTTTGRSAADDLVAFFDAVETTDRDLKAAADAVNGSIGVDAVTIEQSTIDAVDRAEPAAVAAAIPAGLEPAVEQAVLLVYSDLVSRFAALRQGSCLYTQPRSELDPLCFSQGHAAAARMPGDRRRGPSSGRDLASDGRTSPRLVCRSRGSGSNRSHRRSEPGV